MSVSPLTNISTRVERIAVSIGIKFGVSGKWILNNKIFNCYNPSEQIIADYSVLKFNAVTIFQYCEKSLS